jgi:exportin-2 (importin alpha re-exporter)
VLNTLVEFLDPAALAPFMAGIWGLLFTRLQGSKTPKFVRSLTVFIGLFASKHGVNALEESIAKVQPGQCSTHAPHTQTYFPAIHQRP